MSSSEYEERFRFRGVGFEGLRLLEGDGVFDIESFLHASISLHNPRTNGLHVKVAQWREAQTKQEEDTYLATVQALTTSSND